MLQGMYALAGQRPVKTTDSPVDEIVQRGNNYGEMYVTPSCPDGLTAYLNESSYFAGVLSGYTPGTGLHGVDAGDIFRHQRHAVVEE